MVTLFYLKLMNTAIGRSGILELQNWVTRLIVTDNLIFGSEFANFRSTEKISVNFNLKGKIKKMSVITKSKLLTYQLVKITVIFFMLLFLMNPLLFGISLKVCCNFFLDFRFLVTKSV